MSLVNLELRDDHIAWLTINRPEAANSLNKHVLDQIAGHVKELSLNPKVRALVLTSAGEKVFSAGADLKERRELSVEEVPFAVKRIRETIDLVDDFPAPTICALNGPAFGGGFELALACDIRICTPHTTFALTETSLAIIPGAGGTQRLPRAIGMSRAKEMIFTSKKIDAQTAEQWGLVSSVSTSHSLYEEVKALTDQMVRCGPVALRQAKFAMNQGAGTDLKTGIAIEAKAYEITIPTEDRIEGLEAFKEKRKPQYTGR
ncbi:enoyl-CoA hydratase/isomerase family protein [Bacillus sp. H-16]|uniref:enoyl-CoA hydratase-related protein n=1 Tax=Alteribacter salitolerans TaxID=2912333 RepID=UPI001962C084|nr:enoyl-CoA hydratase-related protein [Alteribacter salitolerans]MBM7097383.1 enoyl-CoA hydratase/isomerase family protein [Alteribacter salitolerans]